jgi:xanthine dehydrogenase accessory factor
MDLIHAPIGIDIAAQSPAEIAVAVLAEIVAALRRGRQAERIAA